MNSLATIDRVMMRWGPVAELMGMEPAFANTQSDIQLPVEAVEISSDRVHRHLAVAWDDLRRFSGAVILEKRFDDYSDEVVETSDQTITRRWLDGGGVDFEETRLLGDNLFASTVAKRLDKSTVRIQTDQYDIGPGADDETERIVSVVKKVLNQDTGVISYEIVTTRTDLSGPRENKEYCYVDAIGKHLEDGSIAGSGRDIPRRLFGYDDLGRLSEVTEIGQGLSCTDNNGDRITDFICMPDGTIKVTDGVYLPDNEDGKMMREELRSYDAGGRITGILGKMGVGIPVGRSWTTVFVHAGQASVEEVRP